MRCKLCCLLALLWVSLNGTPVARTILNTSVTHASASQNRCVTACYSGSVSTQLARITLWDTTNPVYPRQGVTINSNYTWGLYHFRQPTVRDSLLFYMDSFVLRIVDIGNIDLPVTLSQLHVIYTQCFAVYDHYVLMGTTDGTILAFDISNPSQPVYVSTSQAVGIINQMWVQGDYLAVNCGFPGNNRASIFAWTPATQNFTELVSVDAGSNITYVGCMDERIVFQKDDGSVHFYSYGQGSGPTPVLQFAGGYNLRKIRTWRDVYYTFGEDNSIRIWQLAPDNSRIQIGHYDLSHFSLDRGDLFELRDERLIYSVAESICIILDVSDLSAPPEFVDRYVTGTDIASLGIPQDSDDIYFMNEDRLDHLQLSPMGLLSESPAIYNTGYGKRLQRWNQFLYLVQGIQPNYSLSVYDLSDPASPELIWEQPVSSYSVFYVKGDFLYVGPNAVVQKYHLEEDGLPSLEGTFSYTIPDNGELVYFLDMDNYAGCDYGIGVWGNILIGYYPILVYWLPGGSTGFLNPPYLLYTANVVDDLLYLSGNGINILNLEGGIPRLESTVEFSTHTKGLESSFLYEDRYLIECYSASNQIRVYDLLDPHNPVVLHIIYQSHSSKAMGMVGNRLVCANGSYGIEVYDLPLEVENQDDQIPAPPELLAWPNPFRENVNLSFRLDKAGPLKLECYNLRGQKVYTSRIEDAKTGDNHLNWDGRDQHGSPCAPGIYLIRIEGRDISLRKKITLLGRG